MEPLIAKILRRYAVNSGIPITAIAREVGATQEEISKLTAQMTAPQTQEVKK